MSRRPTVGPTVAGSEGRWELPGSSGVVRPSCSLHGRPPCNSGDHRVPSSQAADCHSRVMGPAPSCRSQSLGGGGPPHCSGYRSEDTARCAPPAPGCLEHSLCTPLECTCYAPPVPGPPKPASPLSCSRRRGLWTQVLWVPQEVTVGAKMLSSRRSRGAWRRCALGQCPLIAVPQGHL